jgi:hypothetical protein
MIIILPARSHIPPRKAFEDTTPPSDKTTSKKQPEIGSHIPFPAAYVFMS